MLNSLYITFPNGEMAVDELVEKMNEEAKDRHNAAVTVSMRAPFAYFSIFLNVVIQARWAFPRGCRRC